jgi:heme/copper-type cytochrome/quinol oxidase subunit 4
MQRIPYIVLVIIFWVCLWQIVVELVLKYCKETNHRIFAYLAIFTLVFLVILMDPSSLDYF